jgi:hypothetical protein
VTRVLFQHNYKQGCFISLNCNIFNDKTNLISYLKLLFNIFEYLINKAIIYRHFDNQNLNVLVLCLKNFLC